MTSMVVEIVPQHTNQLEQVWKYDKNDDMLPRIPSIAAKGALAHCLTPNWL